MNVLQKLEQYVSRGNAKVVLRIALEKSGIEEKELPYLDTDTTKKLAVALIGMGGIAFRVGMEIYPKK